MEKLLCEEQGLNAQISVYTDKVVITRTGLHAKLLGKTTEALISKLQGISFREGGFSAGYLRLLLGGDKPDVAGTDMNPHTVMFKKKSNEAMKRVKDCIYSLMDQSVQSAQGSSAASVNPPSAAEEIKKYKELLDNKVITEEEFEMKKKQLLGL